MNQHAPTSTKELYTHCVLGTYGRFDLQLARGEGAFVWDESGKKYLDFGAGIAVCSLGHCHPEVTRAVVAQASTLVHTSNLYYTRPQAELASLLVSRVGDGRVFFCNSGAEANEGLIKLSRKFGAATGDRHEVITFLGSFHGRTMTGISATGQEKVKTGFAPLLEGFRHVPFGDLEATESAITPATVAILVEPVQGEGGIHIASREFLQGLRALCDKHNLLLLFDEIQCGLGRTGDWCGWRTIAGTDAEPDAVSWAKGIANGFPLGAFWVRDKAFAGTGGEVRLPSLLGPGSHGTTYGGNAVTCAAGLAVFSIIERENLLLHAKETGASLAKKIRAIGSPLVKEVRQIGLMVGIEILPSLMDLPTDAPLPSIVATLEAMQQGILVIPAGEKVIRLLPPLNIRETEIQEAVEKLAAVFRSLETRSSGTSAS